MIEAEISRVDKQISSIKYPTWDPSMIMMEEDQLTVFCAHVDAKIEACDQGIKFLKDNAQGFVPNMVMENTTATTSHSNQVNYLQNISQSEVLLDDFSCLIDVPLNSTNELNDLEFEELIMGLSSCDWPYQACDDLVGCSSKVDESVLPSICVEYQGGEDLHVLSPSLDVFQTNYYNMFFFNI